MHQVQLAFFRHRAVGELVEDAVVEDQAVLEDFHERRPVIGMRALQHLDEVRLLGVDAARDESAAGAEGKGGRGERPLERPGGRRR